MWRLPWPEVSGPSGEQLVLGRKLDWLLTLGTLMDLTGEAQESRGMCLLLTHACWPGANDAQVTWVPPATAEEPTTGTAAVESSGLSVGVFDFYSCHETGQDGPSITKRVNRGPVWPQQDAAEESVVPAGGWSWGAFPPGPSVSPGWETYMI